MGLSDRTIVVQAKAVSEVVTMGGVISERLAEGQDDQN